MRRLIWIMAAIMVLPLLPGCSGKEAERMMDEADSLIVSQPEFALAILDDIPRSGRSRGANEARYNMLRTEAAYRALDDTIIPDSAIAASVNYYTRKDDKANAARARYYLAMLKMQRNEHSAATVDLLMAENDARQSSVSHFQKGLIYRGLGECFEEFYDMPTSITYQKRAYKEFMSSKDSLYAGYALAVIAARYLDLRKNHECIQYAKKASEFGLNLKEDNLYIFANLLIADRFVYNDKSEDAIKIYCKLHSIDSTKFKEKDYVNWGYAYILNGEIENARRCNTHVKELERAMNSIDVNILLHEGRYKECSELLISTFDILDSVKYTIWTRNDLSVINDYYNMQRQESQQMLEKEKTRRNTIIIISILTILLGIISYFLIVTSLRKRLIDSEVRAKTLKNEISGTEKHLMNAQISISEMQDRIGELQTNVSDLTARNRNISDNLEESNNSLSKANDDIRLKEQQFEERFAKLSKEIHELLSGRFELVNSLLTEKYDLEQKPNNDKSTEKKLTELSKRVQTELEKFVTNPDLTDELETIVNSRLENLIENLRKYYPDFNDNYINIYMYALLKFSPAAIATLQKCALSTVYSRKSKLKKRIKDSNCERKNLYLLFFD